MAVAGFDLAVVLLPFLNLAVLADAKRQQFVARGRNFRLEFPVDPESFARLNQPSEEPWRISESIVGPMVRTARSPEGSLYSFSGDSEGPVTRWPLPSGTR